MNRNFTLLINITFIFSFTVVFSQAPIKQWDVRFGGNEGDALESLQQTTDGGYIMGGYSFSGISGDKTQASQGNQDYWIIKTDAAGTKLWDARFGGDLNDELTCVRQTSDGGYILGGHSSSGISGDKSQASQGNLDYWIVKTDGNGAKLWDARFGGVMNDMLYSLQQTSDGGYILGGYSESGVSGDKTQPCQGISDYWIVKTDGFGAKQWDARFGGSLVEEFHSLQQTSDGGYILGGKSESGMSGDKTQASKGAADYWIVKTDANGVKQWDRGFGGSSGDALKSLQQTTDGGYILGGHSYSGISGDKTQASQGGADYWIVKTDASGLKQWDARFGGSTTDFFLMLQQTADGGYILGGDSNSGISGDKTESNWGLPSTTDYWIVKTDINGVKQWDERFGGNSSDLFLPIQQTSDGGYILGGYSRSDLSGDKTSSSEGNFDWWIVKTAPEVLTCSVPTLPSAYNITSSSANVKWDVMSGATKYKIRYKPINAGVWTTLKSTLNDVMLTSLLMNTEYLWQVKSICGTQSNATSPWSQNQYFTTAVLRFSELISAQNAPAVNLLEIYPNPISKSATVSFNLNKTSPVTIELKDLNGRSIKKVADMIFLEGGHEITLNCESLNAGIYFLQLKDNSGVEVKKIVVE